MLGEVIYQLREARGWSQYELATRSGVGQSYISMLEQGARPKPGALVLNKLAVALGTTVEALLRAAESPQAFPAEGLRATGMPEAEIMRTWALWRDLTDERPAVLKAARQLAEGYSRLNDLTTRLHDQQAPTIPAEPHPAPSC